jgi:DNA-binding NarL/FixJ family response regulator
MLNDNNDMKVVLANYSDLILERLKELLSIHRQVDIVASLKNGDETLAAIKNLKPDLVIVDINMPGLNGLEILNEVRRDNRTTKIIILTFYSSEHYRKIAMLSGADFFFNKADDFEKISLIVERLMRDSKYNTNVKWQV